MASSRSAVSTAAAPPGALAADDEPPEDPRFRVMRRLVNALLMVMIAGMLAITIALLLKLKQIGPSVQPLAPGETVVSAVATADRVTLTLRAPDGGERVLVLDGANFQPLREIIPAPKAE